MHSFVKRRWHHTPRRINRRISLTFTVLRLVSALWTMDVSARQTRSAIDSRYRNGREFEPRLGRNGEGSTDRNSFSAQLVTPSGFSHCRSPRMARMIPGHPLVTRERGYRLHGLTHPGIIIYGITSIPSSIHLLAPRRSFKSLVQRTSTCLKAATSLGQTGANLRGTLLRYAPFLEGPSRVAQNAGATLPLRDTRCWRRRAP